MIKCKINKIYKKKQIFNDVFCMTMGTNTFFCKFWMPFGDVLTMGRMRGLFVAALPIVKYYCRHKRAMTHGGRLYAEIAMPLR